MKIWVLKKRYHRNYTGVFKNWKEDVPWPSLRFHEGVEAILTSGSERSVCLPHRCLVRLSERNTPPLLEWMPVLQSWALKESHQGKEYLVWPDVQVCFKKAWNSDFSVKCNFFKWWFASRKNQLSYDFMYRWNLKKKWYKWAYFLNGNRLTDRENRIMVTKWKRVGVGRGRKGWWEISQEVGMNTHTTVHKTHKTTRTDGRTQGTLLSIF